MKLDYANHSIWLDSYTEDYVGLEDHKTYIPISFLQYKAKYQDIAILQSMVVQTVKPDKFGNPVHAKKSYIVVLGNHKETPWTKSSTFTPVLRKERCCLLTSMPIKMGHT